MKNKRIWLIIGCILIAGILITRYTNSFITRKETQSVTTAGAASVHQEAEEVLADAAQQQEPAVPEPGRSPETSVARGEQSGTPAPAPRETIPETAPAGPGAVPEAVAVGDAAAAANDQTAVKDQAAAHEETASGPVSPIEGVHGKGDPGYLIRSDDYRQRLADLDNQILKLREEDKDATAYTLKNTAESELKLWQSEMGSVYSALIERSPEQEAADLAAEQQEWLKSRDARAAEQNSRNSTANLESVGYITSLVSITRDRTYELVGRYEVLTAGDSGM